MKRTIVQLDDETWRRVREQAFRQQRSMSSLVRELVARGLDGGASRPASGPQRLESVSAGRSAPPGRRVAVSEDHDAALAAILET